MDKQGKKSIHKLMRSLHRDIGFLVIGMTLIYAISGIVLIYRDTNVFKIEQLVEKKLEPGITDNNLGSALHMRHFRVQKTEGDVVYFNTDGTYNKISGDVKYTSTTYPQWIQKMNGLHMSPSSKVLHWFGLVYGIALAFLAISSFWMFKVSSRFFKRGMIFTAVGLILAIILLSV
nr:PepSY domain-containing protein [uncultured Carboxylicivirga sp.]